MSLTANGGATTVIGTNTYTGLTTVNGGLLSVNGSIASDVTVNAGGTLGGNGTVGNTTINGGALAPGNSIGTAQRCKATSSSPRLRATWWKFRRSAPTAPTSRGRQRLATRP